MYTAPDLHIMVSDKITYVVTLAGKNEEHSDHHIKAICNNCKKRFNSMSLISKHFKVRAHHTVRIIEYGNYDKRTGLKLNL